jgi:hypothetical protein
MTSASPRTMIDRGNNSIFIQYSMSVIRQGCAAVKLFNFVKFPGEGNESESEEKNNPKNPKRKNDRSRKPSELERRETQRPGYVFCQSSNYVDQRYLESDKTSTRTLVC